jgi:hypothetical protein
VFGLLLQIGTEARAVQPVVETINVVTGWLSLTENENVDDAKRQRHSRYDERKKEAHFQCAETNEQHHDKRERTAGHEPKQVPFQSPRPAFGIVGGVRVREFDLLFQLNVPTSTVELPMPKAVNNAFTMTGAPAMMSPPIMESFPASVSPRRIAKPPPMTQSVPKRKPMSMTMPKADEAPDERLPDVCAKMGLNPASEI